MLNQPDILLLERLKSGDCTAFDALYLKYFKLLCTSAFFYVKNESEAKDLVQALFLDIWEKKRYLHFHEDVKGYLFLSIKNRCLNFLKGQKVKDDRQQKYALSYDEVDCGEGENSTDYQQRLNKALQSMKGQKRVALTMVYLDKKKYQDAADTMGISINSLKTHLKGALKMLRKELE